MTEIKRVNQSPDKEINFALDGQTLRLVNGTEKLVSNSKNIYKCTFYVPHEWLSAEIFATFSQGRAVYNVMLDEQQTCYIPSEVLRGNEQTKLLVGLFATGAEGKVVTTTLCEIPLLRGTSINGASSIVTFSLFEQIMKKIDEVKKGEVEPELILEAVNEHFNEHPIDDVVVDEVAEYITEHAAELKGAKGDKGDTGAQGIQGIQGVKGDKGDKGDSGDNGKTAYQIAVDNGFDGTEEQWLASLKGAKGDKGEKGASYDDAEIKAEIDDISQTINTSDGYNRSQVVYGENRYYHDANKITQNAYIDETTGEIRTYNGWAVTDYVPVEANEVYVMTYSDGLMVSNNNYYALYDASFRFIRSATSQERQSNTIITTVDTAYIRTSQVSVRFSENTMIIKKSVFDNGVSEVIPFSVRFINDTDSARIGLLQEEIDSKIATNDSLLQYDNVVRSIQRIGGVGNTPHHSIIGYKNAYKQGFRILLCDLRFTSDDVPVLFHDTYLNQHYSDVYDSNGQLVSTTSPIYISSSTYEQLSEYDYGLYKGEAYRGYPLMTLYDMLALVKTLGAELYIEVKEMTEAQALIACNAVKAYGMAEKTSWCGTLTQMRYVISNIDTARVSTMPETLTDTVITDISTLKTGKNKVFFFAWNTTVLTDTIVAKLIQNDIAFEIGTLNSETDILNYFSQGNAYYYCTGIESDTIIAGKTILEDTLN